jgi:hypothetical protein
MTVVAQIVFIVAWVFVLGALVLEGVLRSRERDEERRRAAADMFTSKEVGK